MRRVKIRKIRLICLENVQKAYCVFEFQKNEKFIFKSIS